MYKGNTLEALKERFECGAVMAAQSLFEIACLENKIDSKCMTGTINYERGEVGFIITVKLEAFEDV